MTPHISAKKEDIAPIVIMPGDPLRAKWIAEKYLNNYKLINEIRGMLGYTGYYKNKLITVFAHGMGIPSVGIYSYELFHFYDAKYIIRVGSCGSYKKEYDVGDVVVAKDIVSNTNYEKEMGIHIKGHTIKTNPQILQMIKKIANKHKIKTREVRVICTDAFYGQEDQQQIKKTNPDVVETESYPDVVEMESYGLYLNALKLKKTAFCLLTVSDSFVNKKTMTPEERQTSLKHMIELALECATKLYEKI